MMNQTTLPDEDMAYTILSDLKRVTREYATAATESVCPDIRQMFTQLLNDTLKMQGELFTAMQSNNMYNASSQVLKPEIDKQVKQYQQTQQKTNQFVQQTRAAQAQFAQSAATGQASQMMQ
ncbi:spore coat protein [Cohnella suwonensis]|uniref:Spore coat protein n=1 Tax=Cohnella suwonensis TaxID=696072 RepID=A0ABW0LUL1_9BACL